MLSCLERDKSLSFLQQFAFLKSFNIQFSGDLETRDPGTGDLCANGMTLYWI